MILPPDDTNSVIRQVWELPAEVRGFENPGIYTVGNGILLIEGVPESLIELQGKIESARNGSIESEFQVALYFLREIDSRSEEGKKRGIEILKRLSRLDHAGAKFALGQLIEFDLSQSSDLGQALALYERSADLGYTYAMYYLAVMHLDRKRACYDLDAAHRWMRAAAENGVSLACEAMAENFSPTIEKKRYWLEKAAEKGLYSAQTGLARVYSLPGVDQESLELSYFWSAVAKLNAAETMGDDLQEFIIEIPPEKREKSYSDARRWLSIHPRLPISLSARTLKP